MLFENSQRFSVLSAWALSFGCAVGWGAFVMPATTLLPIAGPLGTVIALVLGAVLMGVIAYNFHIMMNRIPGNGSVFSFTKQIFGYDHSFLCTWATALAYLAVLWANMSAFVLIIRFLFGPVLQKGFNYTVMGYQVWAGELFSTLAIILLFGFISCRNTNVLRRVNTVLALIFFAGVVALFAIIVCKGGIDFSNMGPAFATAGAAKDHSHFMQIVNVLVLAPWAFVGFGVVSFASSTYDFKPKYSFGIMVAALAAGAIVYALIALLSVSANPAGTGNWENYFANLQNFKGIDAVPAFHAVFNTLGNGGLVVLAITIFAAISTSLLGLYRSLGRMFLSLAEDSVVPSWFGHINRHGATNYGIIYVMILSCVIPFFGRTAIGWIVDITSISASIIYLYVSAGIVKMACCETGKRKTLMNFTGILGVVISTFFFFFPLTPTLWNMSTIATESFMILMAWSFVGFIVYRAVFMRDQENRFGKSSIMWVTMLFILMFSAVMWERQVTNDETEEVIAHITEFHTGLHEKMHVPMTDGQVVQEKDFMEEQMDLVRDSQLKNNLVETLFIVLCIFIVVNIYRTQKEREQKLDHEKHIAEESNRAKTIFLSNMSHDLRTPMNAIIGYTNLARKPEATHEQIQKYLTKIDSSNMYLMALINDMLEMSRIEIGKMELEERPTDLRKMMDEIRDMFEAQMVGKNITFTVNCDGIDHPEVLCDRNRMNRVILNLVSNSFKFTSEGGHVSVTLAEKPCAEEGKAAFEIRVKDDGIGISPEFADRVFDAFERERVSTISGVQGTGLGLAIAKSVVTLMGGTITFDSTVGKGTEFFVNVELKTATGMNVPEDGKRNASIAAKADFTNMRLLLVEDMEVNRELAKIILESLGFKVEMAVNGKEAVEMVEKNPAGYYNGVIMDIQMPIMDGCEASRQIRALPDQKKAEVPIIAMTANAFGDDLKKSKDAGMNAHLAKPIDVGMLTETLAEWLR
jgi:signal transduction histidine kinase/ActR/RegA family two-component response regulator